MRFRPEIDYYEILQVHPKASQEIIKKAYRTLMGELGGHPDLGGDEENAKVINEAYTVLGDPELRRAYDRARVERMPRGQPGSGADPGVKEMLTLDAVNTNRGPAHILRDISLQVGEGETVCLIGRNGAGKTTTMESIMGLLPLRSGRVTLGGQEITRLGAHARARLGIGYAPDDCGIFPDLTVAENLGIGHWLAATSRRAGGSGAQETRSEAMYGLFPELPRLLQRRGLHLSGGERKMVAIARCMALGPSVLLLDEAFEGLAPMVVNRFADAVQKIKAMGISMLIAESNVMTAAKVAERFYVIDRGEIIFEGTPAEVFANREIMQVIRG